MATAAAYNYDKLGRLTQVAFNDGSAITYNYDNMGNRTSVVQVAASTLPTVAALPKPLAGSFPNNPMMVLLSNGLLKGWADNTTGALANGLSESNNSPIQDILFDPNTTVPPASESIVDWAFTNANLYVVYSNGWVYSAGKNHYGQLGHGDNVHRPYLKRIEYFVTNSLSVSKVWAASSASASSGGGCVYFQAADYSMYGCGANTAGNLGNASSPTSNVSTPAPCAGIGYSANHVVDVQASSWSSSFSAYMLFDDGTLKVAGYNGQGQLGTGNTSNVSGSFVSSQITGGSDVSNFVSIQAHGGYSHGGNAIAIDSNGDCWSTGHNGDGELGLGNTTSQTVFTKITALSNIVDAKIGGGGHGYAYALDDAGVLYTWGYNSSNNLFLNNSSSPVTTPTQANFVPGTIEKVFLPRPDNLGTSAAQMIVLSSDGLIAYAGADDGQIGIDNALYSGAYKVIPTPRSILDAAETIQDLFVHGYQNSQRWFVHTAGGNLYALGSNEDSICTGGYSSDAKAPNVAWFKISFSD